MMNENEDAECQILEYYGLDEAEELVYRGKPALPQPPMSAPSTLGRTTSLAVSTGSSSGSSSYSSSYSSDVGRSNSLRTSPRSPRGSTHRRLAIIGSGGESSLVIPSDVAAELKSSRSLRHRPSSTPLKAASTLPSRAHHAHYRSASDSTAMARQPSDSSVYSDDSTEAELVPPALVKRSSTSDRSSQSPTPDSRPLELASPLTPGADTLMKDHGPIVVGLGLKDLIWSPDIREDYVAHRPHPKPVQGPSYIGYQPGLHSSAGPPPRMTRATGAASTPPPRPPRLHSPQPSLGRSSHEAAPATDAGTSSSSEWSNLHDATNATSAALAEDSDFVVVPRASDMLSVSSHDGNGDVSGTVRSFHAREGAFPPSKFLNNRGQDTRARPAVTTATFDTLEEIVAQATAYDEASSVKSRNSPPPPPSSFVHPLQRDKSLPRIVRESSESPDSSPVGDRTLRDNRRHSDMSRSSSGHQSRGTITSKHLSMDSRARQTPSPAPSSSRSHSGSSRDELPEIPQHERFLAMPRTPSSLSMTSGIDHISTYDSTKTPTGKRRRAPGIFPPTMLFQDILKRKSALDRGAAYARRMADLMEDSSGLEDWVEYMKQRHKPAAPPNRHSVRMSIRPVRPPGTRTMQPRHVSNGSIASEATFPIRPDAYLAQDLTPHEDTDLSPPTGPPALPYPGLANGIPSRPGGGLGGKPGFSPSSSLRSIASSSSTGKSSGGFFATISRKASMKKTNGPPLPLAPQPSIANRLMSRRGTQALPQPRPIMIGAAPTIPGGPRPQGMGPRVMRSNTVGADAFAAVRQAAGVAETIRSPIDSNPYSRQLKGMVDLLPHVDSDTLSVYLQRADGKEINAIGAYLEDEKNGTIKTSRT